MRLGVDRPAAHWQSSKSQLGWQLPTEASDLGSVAAASGPKLGFSDRERDLAGRRDCHAGQPWAGCQCQ